MELGAKHVESPFIEFGQISTVIYFAHFLIIVPLISLFENSLMVLSRESYHYWDPLHYNPRMVLSGFMPSPVLCAPRSSRVPPKPGSSLEQLQAQSASQGNGWVIQVEGTGPKSGQTARANPQNGVIREYDPVTKELGPVNVREAIIGADPGHVERTVKHTRAHYESMPLTKIQEDFSVDSDRHNPHGTDGGQGDNGDSGPSAGPTTGPSAGPTTGPSGGPTTGPTTGPSAGSSPDQSPPSAGPSPDLSNPASPNPVSDPGSPTEQ